MLHILAASAVLAAAPQCSTRLLNCLYKRATVPYADDFFGSPENGETQCNMTNYLAADTCLSHSNMHFTITSPPELAHTTLYNDLGYTSALELDLNHAMNGKELEVVSLGRTQAQTDTSRWGCQPGDWADKSYSGKIVLVRRGSCGFAQKAERATAAGAAVMLEVTDSLVNRLDLQVGVEEGEVVASSGVGIPTGRVPATGIDQVIQHIAGGGSARGKVELTCMPPQPSSTVLDECPLVAEYNTAGVGGCNMHTDTRRKLCARCQAEMDFGNLKLCLRGNDLLPRKASTMLWSSGALPMSGVSVVFLASAPTGGCAASEYAAHAGKVVIVKASPHCNLYAQAYAAQQGGAAVVVVAHNSDCIEEKYCSPKYSRPLGPSAPFSIPVHGVQWSSFKAFDTHARTQTALNGAVSFSSVSIAEGSFPEYIPEPPAPTEYVQPDVARDPEKGFEWTSTVTVCLVFIVVLMAAIGLKLGYERTQLCELSHIRGARCNIPLSAASTMLSLSLLVAMALAAFLLAQDAGNSSTDNALSNGRKAVDATLGNAVTNVEELNIRWMATLLDTATTVTKDWFAKGTRMAEEVRGMMVTYNGTWAEFDALWLSMLSVSRSEKWHLAIRTREGFFMNKDYKTDDRPNNERNDGHAHVSVTNDGTLYPNLHQWRYREGVPYSFRVRTRSFWDPMQKVGGHFGDVFKLVDHFLPEAKSPRRWLVPLYSAKLTWPTMMPQPISVVVPVFNTVNRRLVATVEAQVATNKLAGAIQGMLGGLQNTGNVTVVIMSKDGVIFAGNTPAFTYTDRFTSDTVNSAQRHHTLDDTTSIELRALGGYLRRINGGELITEPAGKGTFNEAENYVDPYGQVVMNFDFNNGPDDTSPQHYYGLASGTTMSKLVSGGELRLTGSEAFLISTYVTTETWNVAGTRVSALGQPFRSSYRMFNNTRMIHGKEVVVPLDYNGNELPVPMLHEGILTLNFTVSVRVFPEAPIQESSDPNSDPTSPRIFSDTDTAFANVRLFANGVLYFGTTVFGCITDPIPGGLPLNKWSNVIATVKHDYYEWYSPGTGHCAVYVDGKLVSSVPLARNSWQSPSSEPVYRVGDNFVGRLDDLILLNVSITDSEARELSDTGWFRRHVQDKDWRYQYHSLSIGGNPSIPLVAGVLVPQADILRSVLANNAVTQRNLETEEANMKQKKDLKTNETIFVLVTIALASVLIFLLFNTLLTAPFSKMAELMMHAAMLRIDEVPVQNSLLTEIMAMQFALGRLLSSLKEYKSYMPQSIIIAEAMSETDGANDGDESEASSDDSRSHTESTRGSLMSNTTTGTMHTFQAKMKLATSLTKSMVTLLVLNIRSFHALLKGNDKVTLSRHSAVTQTFLEYVSGKRGVCETFSGDRFSASFNASRSAQSHRSLGTSAALLLSRDMRESYEVDVSCSVVSGSARVGNMGSDRMKRFSFVSSSISWGFVLERVCAAKNCSVLVDAHLMAHIPTEFVFQRVATVCYPKHSDSPISVFTVLQQRDQQDREEWMYEMDRAERSDPMAQWNEYANAVFAEEWETVKDVPEETKMQAATELSEELRYAYATRRYTPFDARYF